MGAAEIQLNLHHKILNRPKDRQPRVPLELGYGEVMLWRGLNRGSLDWVTAGTVEDSSGYPKQGIL